MMEINERITAVIPTYNRCPHSGDKIKFNPLWWAAHSLFQEKNVNEIVFVDDYSSDNFDETIARLEEIKPSQLTIKCQKNSERNGSGISRNKGVNLASNSQIFFYDDDCIFASKGVLSGLQTAFTECRKNNPLTSAMTLPVSGNSLGSRLYPSSLIGRVDRSTGILHGCYSKYPTEYARDGLKTHLFINGTEIASPLEIELMGGVFLCDKSAFQKAGGFPKTKVSNACAEEPELMLNIQRQKGKIFYLPSLDRSFRVIHLRYGDSSFSRNIDYPNFSLDGLTLKDIIKSSAIENRSNHGNRVTKRDEVYSNILSNSRLLFKYADIFGVEAGFNHLRTRFFENVEYGGFDTFRRAVKDVIDVMIEEKIIDETIAGRIRKEMLKD